MDTPKGVENQNSKAEGCVPEPELRHPTCPMFQAAVAFGGGILLATRLWHPTWIWLTAILLLAAAAFFLRARLPLVARATVLAAFVCSGAFCQFAADSRPQSPARILAWADGQDVTLTGWVSRDGVLHSSTIGDPRQSLDFQVERVEREGEPPVNVNGGVRLSIFIPRHADLPEFLERDDSEPQPVAAPMRMFTYGQRLRLVARLHIPTNYRNPGAMDYVGYLQSQGVQSIGSAKLTLIDVLSEHRGTRLGRMRSVARRSIFATIHRIWPEPDAGLFDAMLLGERDFVAREQRLEFQRSGTYHLLVVSGMNVAVLAAFLYWFLRRLRAGADLAVLLTLLIICGYAWLTDLGAPILRSVLMITAAQLTQFFYRERNALNGIGVAALAILVWDPRQLTQASFQLTFLAVVTIAGVALPIIERTSEPWRRALHQLWAVGRDPSLPPRVAQFRLDVRMISSKLGRLISQPVARRLVPGTIHGVLAAYELVLVSALMQLSMTLPTAWYFHRVAVYGLWANLAVLPLTSVLMPSSVLAVTVSYASGWLARPLARVASWSLAGITGTVHHLGAMGRTDMRIAMPPEKVVLAFIASFALALLLARRHRWLCELGVAALIAASAAVILVHPPIDRRPDVLEITAIDVGQGDSLLLVTPRGKTLLLDSGGPMGGSHSEFDVGEEVVSPYLWSRGIDHLDAVAFSHGHSDHIGGMASVIRNFHPDEIWFAPTLPTHEFLKLAQAAIDDHAGAVLRRAPDSFEFGGAYFRVLSPKPGVEIKPRDLDDNSMVLRVANGKTAALLPGDIHKKIEESLAESKARALLRCDLLKIPHHGSKTSSTPEFLHAVHPKLAVISDGRGNPYKHPRPEVLEALAERRIKTYRTDMLGPVTFYLDGSAVEVRQSALRQCQDCPAGWGSSGNPR